MVNSLNNKSQFNTLAFSFERGFLFSLVALQQIKSYYVSTFETSSLGECIDIALKNLVDQVCTKDQLKNILCSENLSAKDSPLDQNGYDYICEEVFWTAHEDGQPLTGEDAYGSYDDNFSADYKFYHWQPLFEGTNYVFTFTCYDVDISEAIGFCSLHKSGIAVKDIFTSLDGLLLYDENTKLIGGGLFDLRDWLFEHNLDLINYLFDLLADENPDLFVDYKHDQNDGVQIYCDPSCVTIHVEKDSHRFNHNSNLYQCTPDKWNFFDSSLEGTYFTVTIKKIVI